MLLASLLVYLVGTTFISQACYQPASSNINRLCPCQALMPAKQVLIGFGIDVDAVAGWWAFVIEKRLVQCAFALSNLIHLEAGFLWWRRLSARHIEGEFWSCHCNTRTRWPVLIAQGMYAGEVGVPRLLKLLKKYSIQATWFIPGKYSPKYCYKKIHTSAGHSLETFPEQMKMVRDAGHEM